MTEDTNQLNLGDAMGKGRGTATSIALVPVNKIKLGRNSRLKGSVDDLMQSIKETGLLQPIGLTKTESGGYEVNYGNRRFLACTKLGMTKIPAVIHTGGTATEIDIRNLTENIQRRAISLVEAGRYMNLLKEQGLSKPEIAARLGVSPSYVRDCFTAFGDVPEKFREDIEVARAGDKRTVGKLSIMDAQAVISAKKSLSLDDKQTEKLFKFAKEKEFKPKNARAYGIAIKSGKDPANAKVMRTHTTVINLTQNEYDRLYEKHVVDGPLKSFSGLVVAILRGEKSETIKCS